MVGGAHRGPVGAGRQRRTLRFVQGLLVLMAAGFLVFAGYSLGRAEGFESAEGADPLAPPTRPSIVQTIVLAAFGLGSLAGAFSLQGPSGMRMPVPARLDELAGRAEAVAIEKAGADSDA